MPTYLIRAGMPAEPTDEQAPRPAELDSLVPGPSAHRRLRRRLPLSSELTLAVLPTATVLAVLGLLQALTEQKLLFASLASSAFLIYLDPKHGTNSVRTLISSQLFAAAIGFAMFWLAGTGFVAAGGAMVLTIVLMIVLDVVHPPAVATSMSFALRAGEASNFVLFVMAVLVTGTLVLLQRAAVWLMARHPPPPPDHSGVGDSSRRSRNSF